MERPFLRLWLFRRTAPGDLHLLSTKVWDACMKESSNESSPAMPLWRAREIPQSFSEDQLGCPRAVLDRSASHRCESLRPRGGLAVRAVGKSLLPASAGLRSA